MIPDPVLAHLREVVGAPDLSGTRYELVGALGRGGMGEVYRVRDRVLGREAALKVVEDAAPMLEEARTAARLEHPGIVPIYDAGVLEDGRGYCVMKLVEGKRLDECFAGKPGLAGRLEVILKLCDAMSFAHHEGVVHRDLKPQNVVVGRYGEVVVLDWGVALRTQSGDGGGVVVGTRRYMAPEQAGGKAVDARVDVYSLGVMIEELLPEGAGRALRAIAAKARADEPGERYQSVAELALDLRRYQDRLPVSAHRENLLERLQRFAARNAVLLLLLLAYVVVRVLLFFTRPL